MTVADGTAAATGAADRAPILGLHDVHFAYGSGPEVLADVSLDVAPRSIVGVVGPSGGGKTTLLYLIAGLLEPTAGTIERRTQTASRHDLSMVFQKDTLLPWLTAAENVRLFTRFRKHRAARRGIDGRVTQLLEMVGLGDREDAYPYQLSGGMRRRLQFLSGVAPYPQILLLDEPFASVDEPTRIGIHQDVFGVMRSLEMTAILVTHDLAEAITLCDRVVILSSGPATIVKDFAIPFGDERDMLHIRATREYLDLYGEVWDHLSAQIVAARARPGA